MNSAIHYMVDIMDHLITSSKNVLGGTPVFAGTRVPFQSLIDYLEAWDLIDTFLEDFPTVTREQVIVALETAKEAFIKVQLTA